MHIYPDPLCLRREHREMDTNVVNLATRRRSHPYSSPFPPPKTTSPSTAMAKFHTFMCPHPSSPLFCCLGCRLKLSQDIECERNKKKLRCKWSFQYSTTQLPPKGFRQFAFFKMTLTILPSVSKPFIQSLTAHRKSYPSNRKVLGLFSKFLSLHPIINSLNIRYKIRSE